MILLPAFGLVLLTVVLAGGRLARLADLRLHWVPLLWLTMLVQVLLTTVLAPVLAEGPARWAHLATYAAAAAVLLRNLAVRGMTTIGVGGGMNLAAIAANGGVMPARPGALATAGMVDPGHFTNSGAVAAPRLAALGDVFAVPAGWPLANVFSVGDVLLLVGVGVALHAATDSAWARWLRADPAGGAAGSAAVASAVAPSGGTPTADAGPADAGPADAGPADAGPAARAA